MTQPNADLLARIAEKQAQQGLKDRPLSIAIGAGPDFIRDLKRKGSIPGAERLARLADALGTTSDWLLHGGDELVSLRAHGPTIRTEVAGGQKLGEMQRPFNWQPPPKLPHFGSAIGGEYDEIEEHIELTELHTSEVLDWLSRPEELRDDESAYALTVVGDSMFPRFKPGEMVTVTPRRSVALGDDVIVQLRGCDGEDDRVKLVLIKELVKRTARSVTLRQYNPRMDFEVPAARIATDARGRPAIHRVFR